MMAEPAGDTAAAGSFLGGLLQPPFAAAVNHLLKTASWARARLALHAGKSARFEITPFPFSLVLRHDGYVDNLPPTSAADARFGLTPGIVLRVFAGDVDAWLEVQVDGDTALARDILYVAQNLRWDVEEDLSRVFGDIAAHRMVQTGEGLRRWQRESLESLGRSASVYWTEERPLIAARHDIERFLRDVDVLRDDVERAEQRIDNLLRRRSQAGSGPADNH